MDNVLQQDWVPTKLPGPGSKLTFVVRPRQGLVLQIRAGRRALQSSMPTGRGGGWNCSS